MKKTLLLIVPAFLAMAGCHGEEPEVPLSPQAQEALKTGHTGPPAEANQDPLLAARRAGMSKQPGGK